ncbi:uncharacterized protein LDX57_002810 [Aspergillus melleus]|uniref:uncharacterized protein n=1 Tax=Aspergillus melleus TaxID=138277 RepID=UPI001E8E38E0|nr:uncharacterized protein LDX57_002810 [Aspergillus melleus]KAH8425061.1 hypothetical protein LDX57_002810 [Aspergillus melleus]
MDLLNKGTDEVTAQRLDGTICKARYRQPQNQSALGQAKFVWDYQHYPWLVKLSKLSPKWRRVWLKARPWDDVIYHQAATRFQRYLNGEELEDFYSSLMEDKQKKPSNLEWGKNVAEYWSCCYKTHNIFRRYKRRSTLFSMGTKLSQRMTVKNLPFLRACLDEALRILPPTSAGLPRRTPPEGAQIMDEWIPGDTSVSTTTYATHREPKIFPDPENYRPERWLNVEARKRMEPYFIPFSAGARGCIGRNISYLEQAMVLASLVHRYEFALPSPEWELARHEAFNLIVGEMPVTIWRRQMGAT